MPRWELWKLIALVLVNISGRQQIPLGKWRERMEDVGISHIFTARKVNRVFTTGNFQPTKFRQFWDCSDHQSNFWLVFFPTVARKRAFSTSLRKELTNNFVLLLQFEFFWVHSFDHTLVQSSDMFEHVPFNCQVSDVFFEQSFENEHFRLRFENKRPILFCSFDSSFSGSFPLITL